MNFKLQLVACPSEGDEPLLEDVFTWSGLLIAARG